MDNGCEVQQAKRAGPVYAALEGLGKEVAELKGTSEELITRLRSVAAPAAPTPELKNTEISGPPGASELCERIRKFQNKVVAVDKQLRDVLNRLEI